MFLHVTWLPDMMKRTRTDKVKICCLHFWVYLNLLVKPDVTHHHMWKVIYRFRVSLKCMIWINSAHKCRFNNILNWIQRRLRNRMLYVTISGSCIMFTFKCIVFLMLNKLKILIVFTYKNIFLLFEDNFYGLLLGWMDGCTFRSFNKGGAIQWHYKFGKLLPFSFHL